MRDTSVNRKITDSLERLSSAIPVARMCTTCRFFNRDPDEMDSPYYCDLLDIPLDEKTLRVDCDEQEPQEKSPEDA